jgi:leader peptidase (prepilin peptidase)/N-methyltransferase
MNLLDLYGYYGIFWAAAAFVFGCVVGSFLNVVIVRLPAEKSIVHPPSHCPSCTTEIRWYDNIPIVSFFVLLGRCRECGERISVRYPIVEFVTGCLTLALVFRWGLHPALGVFFLFCCAMVAVFGIDLDHMIIPDVISLNGIAIGIIASIVGLIPGMDWKSSLIGTLVGGALLYVPAAIYERIRGIEGLGGGYTAFCLYSFSPL